MKGFFLVLLLIYSANFLQAQQLTLDANARLYITPNAMDVAAYNGVQLKGQSSLVNPESMVLQVSDYFSLQSPEASLETEQLAVASTASFVSGVSALSQVDIVLLEGTPSDFSLRLAPTLADATDKLPIQFSISKINSASSDKLSFMFFWDPSLEAPTIAYTTLFKWENTAASWAAMDAEKTSQGAHSLVFNNFEGALENAVFAIGSNPEGSDRGGAGDNAEVDTDNDGTPDNIDTDDDNDGVIDTSDVFPKDPTESEDSDGDGIGDNADPDDDNDGVADSLDDFPKDPNASSDSDGDGIPDEADLDSDNDGFLDGELYPSELITPMEPGEESVWRILNIEKFPAAHVKIFGRDGLEVFSQKNYQNNWNGTYKGSDKYLPAGSYYYRIFSSKSMLLKDGWLFLTY